MAEAACGLVTHQCHERLPARKAEGAFGGACGAAGVLVGCGHFDPRVVRLGGGGAGPALRAGEWGPGRLLTGRPVEAASTGRLRRSGRWPGCPLLRWPNAIGRFVRRGSEPSRCDTAHSLSKGSRKSGTCGHSWIRRREGHPQPGHQDRQVLALAPHDRSPRALQGNT